MVPFNRPFSCGFNCFAAELLCGGGAALLVVLHFLQSLLSLPWKSTNVGGWKSVRRTKEGFVCCLTKHSMSSHHLQVL